MLHMVPYTLIVRSHLVNVLKKTSGWQYFSMNLSMVMCRLESIPNPAFKTFMVFTFSLHNFFLTTMEC